MKNYNKNIQISNFLFFIGWFLFITSHIILKETELMYIFNTENVYKPIKIIVLLIFTIKILFIDKYNFKKLTLYSLVLFLTFINSRIIDNDMFFFTFFIAFSADKIDFKKLIKSDIKLRIIIILSVIMCSKIGLLPNFAKFINGSYKQAFGFSHPNVLCLNVITILLEYMYLKENFDTKYFIKNIIVLLLLHTYCNARTSIYAFIIVFLLYFIKQKNIEIFQKKVIRKVLIFLPIIMIVLSIVMIKEYEKSNIIAIKLDEVLTTRISSGYRFYKEYGIKNFGSKIETVGTRRAIITGEKINILDMGYLRVSIEHGRIICMIFILLLCLYQKELIKIKNYNLLIISTFFIILGLIETNIYNIAYNFTLLNIINVLNNNTAIQKEGFII